MPKWSLDGYADASAAKPFSDGSTGRRRLIEFIAPAFRVGPVTATAERIVLGSGLHPQRRLALAANAARIVA
jgi:hypothetical protein